VTRRELLAGLSGISLASCSRRRAGQQRVRLVVAAGPYLHASGLYLARELGYFAQAGLDLEIQEVPASMQAIPLLVNSQLDASPMALTPAFINAVAGGARVRIVAGRGIVSPTCSGQFRVYGSLKAFPSGLHDARQLKGKRVAIRSRGGFSEFCLDALLAAAGMSQRDIQVVSLQQSEAFAAVASGRVEAMVSQDVGDKDLTSVSAKIVPGLPLAEVLPNFQLGFVMFGKRLLDGDPTVGTRFLAALLRGDREFMQGKTPQFLDDYARNYGLDVKRTREACRDFLAPEGEIRLDSLQRFIAWGVGKGYCPRPVEAEQLIDRRFLEPARKLSGGTLENRT
jgi:NitT/TauT family transport system substrate-binding protein